MADQNAALGEKPLDQGLRQLLGYALKRASAVATGDAARMLEPFGLRVTSYSVLCVICQTPGVTQTQLAAALAMERSNTVAIIDQLEKTGCIERRRSTQDRRVFDLHPLAAGHSLMQQATEALLAYENTTFAALSKDERQMLIRLLSRIHQ